MGNVGPGKMWLSVTLIRACLICAGPLPNAAFLGNREDSKLPKLASRGRFHRRETRNDSQRAARTQNGIESAAARRVTNFSSKSLLYKNQRGGGAKARYRNFCKVIRSL